MGFVDRVVKVVKDNFPSIPTSIADLIPGLYDYQLPDEDDSDNLLDDVLDDPGEFVNDRVPDSIFDVVDDASYRADDLLEEPRDFIDKRTPDNISDIVPDASFRADDLLESPRDFIADRIDAELPEIPDTLADLIPGSNTDQAIELLKNPRRFIRGTFFGIIFGGIASFVMPIFNTISLVFLGSNPTTFAAPGETLGLADLPVEVAGIVGGALGGTLSTALGLYGDIILAAVPDIVGPFELPIAALVTLFLAVVTARAVLPTVIILLEGVPVVGGPLSTLLQMVIDE